MAMAAMTMSSLMKRRLPTTNVLARFNGHPLISLRTRPDSVDRMRSRLWEKWYCHISPEMRWPMAKEYRVWIRFSPRLTSALNRKAAINAMEVNIKNLRSVSSPIREVSSKT